MPSFCCFIFLRRYVCFLFFHYPCVHVSPLFFISCCCCCSRRHHHSGGCYLLLLLLPLWVCIVGWCCCCGWCYSRCCCGTLCCCSWPRHGRDFFWNSYVCSWFCLVFILHVIASCQKSCLAPRFLKVIFYTHFLVFLAVCDYAAAIATPCSWFCFLSPCRFAVCCSCCCLLRVLLARAGLVWHLLRSCLFLLLLLLLLLLLFSVLFVCGCVCCDCFFCLSVLVLPLVC